MLVDGAVLDFQLIKTIYSSSVLVTKVLIRSARLFSLDNANPMHAMIQYVWYIIHGVMMDDCCCVSIDKSTVHRVGQNIACKVITAHLYSSFHRTHFQSA